MTAATAPVWADYPEVAAYRAARDAYYAAGDAADAAFNRWFEKIQAGERTNAAAASRMANEASFLSADMAGAQSKVWARGVDPWDVDDYDGVERSPV